MTRGSVEWQWPRRGESTGGHEVFRSKLCILVNPQFIMVFLELTDIVFYNIGVRLDDFLRTLPSVISLFRVCLSSSSVGSVVRTCICCKFLHISCSV